jgi:hypothetical protein
MRDLTWSANQQLPFMFESIAMGSPLSDFDLRSNDGDLRRGTSGRLPPFLLTFVFSKTVETWSPQLARGAIRRLVLSSPWRSYCSRREQLSDD